MSLLGLLVQIQEEKMSKAQLLHDLFVGGGILIVIGFLLALTLGEDRGKWVARMLVCGAILIALRIF